MVQTTVQAVWDDIQPELTFVPKGFVFHDMQMPTVCKRVWSKRLMCYVIDRAPYNHPYLRYRRNHEDLEEGNSKTREAAV